tara:strand:- start:282 stop:611 length:330 start_codon:yes stop_codon:yes gene_type:complete
VENDHFEYVRDLIDLGANVDVIDTDGVTPFMLAVSLRSGLTNDRSFISAWSFIARMEIVVLLIRKGVKNVEFPPHLRSSKFTSSRKNYLWCLLYLQILLKGIDFLSILS